MQVRIYHCRKEDCHLFSCSLWFFSLLYICLISSGIFQAVESDFPKWGCLAFCKCQTFSEMWKRAVYEVLLIRRVFFLLAKHFYLWHLLDWFRNTVSLMSDIQNVLLQMLFSLNFVSAVNRYIFFSFFFHDCISFLKAVNSYLHFAFGILCIFFHPFPYLLFVSLLHSYL